MLMNSHCNAEYKESYEEFFDKYSIIEEASKEITHKKLSAKYVRLEKV